MAPPNERTTITKPKNLYGLLRLIPVDFGGFFSKLLGFLRFGSSDKNALNTLLDDLELCYP